jgi:hypothetical protein
LPVVAVGADPVDVRKASRTKSALRRRLKAQQANALCTFNLVKLVTIRQKARRFLRWRKKHGRKSSSGPISTK